MRSACPYDLLGACVLGGLGVVVGSVVVVVVAVAAVVFVFLSGLVIQSKSPDLTLLRATPRSASLYCITKS